MAKWSEVVVTEWDVEGLSEEWAEVMTRSSVLPSLCVGMLMC